MSSAGVSGILDGHYAYLYSPESSSVDLVDKYLKRNGSTQSLCLGSANYVDIKASSWSERVNYIQVAQASNSGAVIKADQINFSAIKPEGCAINDGS